MLQSLEKYLNQNDRKRRNNLSRKYNKNLTMGIESEEKEYLFGIGTETTSNTHF